MTNAEVKRLPEGVTEEQLQQHVRKYGQVFPVRVQKDGTTYVGLFRKPTLADMSAAASLGADIAGADLVYNSCKIAVDPAMDTDDEIHLSALKGVGKLFRVLEVSVGEAFGGEA